MPVESGRYGLNVYDSGASKLFPSKKPKGLWLIDFDGTIKPSGPDDVSLSDKETLKELGREGWFRVVATGRSLFSFALAWDKHLDIDALICSSGAAAVIWTKMGPGDLLYSYSIDYRKAHKAAISAREMGLGFFAYHTLPDSHHFHYYKPQGKILPAGFDIRLEMYAPQAWPWPEKWFYDEIPHSISQFLIMVPETEADELEARFKTDVPGLSVIRSSSPFGDGQIWLEIFSPKVSKGQAADHLCRHLGLSPQESVAIGNDYNDLDMLAWAGHPFVVSNAPSKLLDMYARNVISPPGTDGLAQVKKIMSRRWGEQ